MSEFKTLIEKALKVSGEKQGWRYDELNAFHNGAQLPAELLLSLINEVEACLEYRYGDSSMSLEIRNTLRSKLNQIRSRLESESKQ